MGGRTFDEERGAQEFSPPPSAPPARYPRRQGVAVSLSALPHGGRASRVPPTQPPSHPHPSRDVRAASPSPAQARKRRHARLPSPLLPPTTPPRATHRPRSGVPPPPLPLTRRGPHDPSRPGKGRGRVGALSTAARGRGPATRRWPFAIPMRSFRYRPPAAFVALKGGTRDRAVRKLNQPPTFVCAVCPGRLLKGLRQATLMKTFPGLAG